MEGCVGGYVVILASDKIPGSLTVNTFEPDLYQTITVVHGILKKKIKPYLSDLL